mmetsp:Transcript_26708/g.45362  ORF Transcript_26708/g.45362 Transcript_26708/m.45362 type:complete len:80 (+) Transcript_26708:367-606(+)
MQSPFGFDTLGSRIVVDSVVGEIGRMVDVPADGQGYVTTCPPVASIEMPRKNKDATLILILVVIFELYLCYVSNTLEAT